ncbi:MAG: ATP-binding protein [Solirubrobacteraceae bacterium]
MIRRRIAHLGLRLRLTLVFAGAMAVLLAALGTFLYHGFEGSLDRSLNEGLRARAEDVRALVNQADSGLSQAGRSSLATPGERFAQILASHARVLDETPALPARALLTTAQEARARRAPIVLDRTHVPGPAGESRLLAVPVSAQGQRLIVVVGASLRQRDSALGEARAVLLIGGPVALALASTFGYMLAALSLRHVERMRRRAMDLSPSVPGQRLPVPPADDELTALALSLNEMLARNEVAFAREQTFMADASHELRSPLAILKAELEVALVGEDRPEELRRAIASAAEEAARLSALSEDLLTLSHADHGRVRLEVEPLDVCDLLTEVAGRFSGLATRAGVQITVQAASGMTLMADRRRLERALSNLIDNALHQGARSVLLSAAEQKGRLQLRVRDDGHGFPEDFLGQAFERFARADPTRTSGGAGLGLSIVRAVAEAHGGEVRAGNAEDGGAVVDLALPLHALDSAVIRAEPSRKGAPPTSTV